MAAIFHGSPTRIWLFVTRLYIIKTLPKFLMITVMHANPPSVCVAARGDYECCSQLSFVLVSQQLEQTQMYFILEAGKPWATALHSRRYRSRLIAFSVSIVFTLYGLLLTSPKNQVWTRSVILTFQSAPGTLSQRCTGSWVAQTVCLWTASPYWWNLSAHSSRSPPGTCRWSSSHTWKKKKDTQSETHSQFLNE